MYDLARNIADLRIKKMYTQKGLADALGVSKGTITSYESGVRVPPIDKLEEIAKLFNIKITDFFVENINDINFSKKVLLIVEYLLCLMLQQVWETITLKVMKF